jgi:hypothetical protein
MIALFTPKTVLMPFNTIFGGGGLSEAGSGPGGGGGFKANGFRATIALYGLLVETAKTDMVPAIHTRPAPSQDSAFSPCFMVPL